MADIDVKFMKATPKVIKQMGAPYKKTPKKQTKKAEKAK